ncbi:MAG: RNA polymerase sigma factor [Bacteroidota bacterium]
MTDEEVIRRLKNGENDIPAVLYDRYRIVLYRYCFGLVKDDDVAQDIVQEVFFKFLKEYRSIQEPGLLKIWLFTVARNEVFSHFKKKSKFREIDEQIENIFFEEISSMEAKERTEIVQALIDTLLPQYKEILFFREYQMMNYEEIAGVTGTTVSSVKSKLFKARKALQEKLQPYIDGRAL